MSQVMNILGRISAINTLAVCYIYSAEVSAKDHGTSQNPQVFIFATSYLLISPPLACFRCSRLSFATLVLAPPLSGLAYVSYLVKICWIEHDLFSGRSHDRAFYSRSQGLWGPGANFAKYTHTIFT